MKYKFGDLVGFYENGSNFSNKFHNGLVSGKKHEMRCYLLLLDDGSDIWIHEFTVYEI